eukprot:gene27211-32876_t
MYFPDVSQFLIGGVLFTIGSLGFTIADVSEWWTNNRVGCCLYQRYQKEYEAKVGYLFDPENGDCFSKGRRQRVANGANFFASAIGSFCYLIGSICFIPELDAFTTGGYIYTAASVLITISQASKLYRAGFDFTDKDSFNHGFVLSNWSRDVPGVCVDGLAGFGGVCYLIGSILFLPQNDANESVGYAAATLFQIGGIAYFLSSVSMGYRYFCTKNYST